MLIEVGKKYKTRGGDIVEITAKDNDEDCPFIADNEYCYTINGTVYMTVESTNDLIEECQAPDQFAVGGVYTAKNGIEYRCIAVFEGHAYMINNKRRTAAYRWNLDGSAVDLDSECSIAFKPAVPAWMRSFQPGWSYLSSAFAWTDTPEGGDFWCEQLSNPTVEGMKRWVEMHGEYAKAKAEGLV